MNRFLISYIRNHSLKSVIITYVLLFALLTLLILTKVSDFFLSGIIMDKYLTSYMNSVYSSFEYTLSDMLTHINISSLTLTAWNELYTVIQDDHMASWEKEQKVHNYTNEFLNTHNLVAAVDIITYDGTIYRNSKNELHFPQISQEFTNTIVSAEMSVYNKPIFSNGEYYIAIGNKFQDFYTGFDIGYLILYIPESNFYSIYQEAMLKDSSFFILADNCIISHSDKSMLGSGIFLPEELYEEKKLSVSWYSKNIIGKYHIRTPTLTTDISIVTIISGDSLYKIVNQMRLYVYCILGIVLLIALIVAFVFTQRLLKQYTQFKQDMKEFAKNPKKQIIFHSSNELRELENSFNVMVKTINQLIEENSVAQEKEREAEIKALQSHINPHFIYNALDTITCMAKISKQPNIEQTSYALADFFRIGLSGGEKLITLQNELKHVKSYLQVQKMRFPDRFDVEFEIPDELFDCKILKVTLQPLVENCVRHAFKNSKTKGKITIMAAADSDHSFILLTVADNGCGFDVNPLSVQKKNKTDGGYGIYNVHQRLKLEYGEDYGLSYEINEFGGTSAIIKIKYIK